MKRGLDFLKNNFPGLFVLTSGLLAYAFTVAPTTSFWDCGEFIASAYGLEVPHPPGAPLFLLLGRLFSLLASDETMIALSVNLLSVMASAFSVFFVYKILVLLFVIIGPASPHGARKNFVHETSAVIGALLFAFTDTFWYSAVEAEVYALSLFFSVATLWTFLKWYILPGNQRRWFFLGVYLLGLSIGVHLLNLLLIPVFVVLFGWKTAGHDAGVTIKSMAAGILLLGVLYLGLVVNGLWPAMKLELWMVNSLGMPKHSGLIAWVIIVVGIHIAGIFITHYRCRILHLPLVLSALVLMGWFSYALVPLRAAANPPINMNAPDDVFSLNDYINRTQYGSRPLLYGVHAGAVPDDREISFRYYYGEEEERYLETPASTNLHFNKEDYVWFPRVYSRQPHHIEGYEWWAGIDAKTKPPEFSHQVDFFLRYQLGHHYLRYVLWNFAGRQNGQQGHGDMFSGNWATGINFIDRYFLGSRGYPSVHEKYSPASNHYYGIPFLLAFLGILFLTRQGHGRRRVLFLLGFAFLMTGPAIVLYLNQPPYEPRERDYVFVASFMFIAFFAAIGVFAILKKVVFYGGNGLTSILSAFLLFLAGPGLLFSVNLNDHDRSDRYLARDLAVSQLRSCPPGAILFTYGDNDTYPLWYAQQVEKIRSDVRLVNLGLLNTNWYIQQVRLALQGSGGLKMTLPKEFYRNNSIGFFGVSMVKSVPLSGISALEVIRDRVSESDLDGGAMMDVIPPVWELLLPDGQEIDWNISGRYWSSGIVALSDIIASNISTRPICFTRNVETDNLYGLEDVFVSNGLVWKLGNDKEEENHSLEREYFIFMDSVSIGREGTAWWDNTCRQALSASGYRQMTTSLARELLENGKTGQAFAVSRKSLGEWPYSPYQEQVEMLDMVRLLHYSGENEKAARLLRNINQVNMENVFFFFYSGFDTGEIRRKYCGLFREIRSLAREMELNDVLLEIEIELESLCSF